MSTDTNIININNLPSVFEIVDGSKLIVQNESVTNTIDWKNVGVIKLNDSGSGSIEGSLTAANINVITAEVGTLSADAIYSSGLAGVTVDQNYYNRFIVTNGIVTSADYLVGSTEFESLSTLIGETSANLTESFTSQLAIASGVFLGSRVYIQSVSAVTDAIANGHAVFNFVSIPTGINDNNSINIGDYTVNISGDVSFSPGLTSTYTAVVGNAGFATLSAKWTNSSLNSKIAFARIIKYY